MRFQRILVIAIVTLAVTGTAQQSGNQLPQKIRVSWGVLKGQLLHTVEPDLPPGADGKPMQGNVVLRINVGRQGNVVRAVRLDGKQELADAAIAAVKQWTFKSFLLKGEPVEMEAEIKLILKPGQPARMVSPR